MVNFTILAGGYASFIASYLFDTQSSTLSLLHQYPTGINVSWIARDPWAPSVLYATNEEDIVGALQSFAIGANGNLSAAVATLSSKGADPAFLAPLSTGEVVILNYNSGNGLFVPTTNDHLRFGVPFEVTFHAPVSHPHFALEHGQEVIVSDLGADKIWRLGKTPPGTWTIHGFIPQPSGSGPRHLAVYAGHLFVLHELSSTLTVQPYPAFPNGTSTIESSAITYPSDGPKYAYWAAAEILIPTPSLAFPVPYIYVSNRNTNTSAYDPRGDSVAIFNLTKQGELSLIKQVFTGLNQIRGMEFSADGKYLIAGGVAGTAGVVVLERTDAGKDLKIIARNLDIPTRTTFVWL